MVASPVKILAKVAAELSRLRQGVSVQKQLLVLGLVSISAMVAFTAWVFVERAQSEINNSVEQFGIAMAQALARGGAEALHYGGDLEGLRHYVLTQLGQTPAIAYVVFKDRQGKIVLDSQSLPSKHEQSISGESRIYPIYRNLNGKPDQPGVYPTPQGYRPLMNIAVPVRRASEQYGMCWVGLDSRDFTILGTPRETRTFLVSIFALVGLLGTLGLAVNYALINRPLKDLADGATELADGRFGHQLKEQNVGREIDQLVKAFNYMSSRLQEYAKQNVDSLLSERSKLELVLMSIADGVVVCDRDNRVQIVNAAAAQLFDKDVADIIGNPVVFCTEGPDSPQICQVIQAFTDTLNPGSLEPVIKQIHLGERTVRLNIAPLILENEFLGSVMIMQDITRQAELERMKNEFMSNVSHELRTPITSIKSYVDTLCNHGEKLTPAEHREFLETIDNEADRLAYLVNEVLELSRVEEGETELEVAPQDIKRAAEYAVRAVQLMAADKQIEVRLTLDEKRPMVDINQESIERAVINLLTNAIKYTPSGGHIEVRLADIKDTCEVEVSVTDNGIGIPEEHLPHIFDRFYRVERKVHTIKGTGLGLTIVKKIIERHHGRVQAKSALGHGSTFSFFIPYAEKKPASGISNRVAKGKAEGGGPPENLATTEVQSLNK